MRVTKWYCDVCGKEIKSDPLNTYIPVKEKVGKHGVKDRSLKIIDRNGNVCLDFCDDCKATIAILFGGSDDQAD